MHPGYIVCILLLSIYLLGEGLLLLRRKGPADKGFILLFGVWILSIILSCLNPNGFSVFGKCSTLENRLRE